jgi:RNA-directed DNA polymerase
VSCEVHAGFCERRGVRLPPATHPVVGFEHHDDAQRFLADLRGRFAEFNLELAAGKTRLIEFGRFAAQNRKARGRPKPETFDFLGLTHICGTTRGGRFALKRVTSKRRLRAKLREVKTELRRRRHLPIPVQGQWLASVVRGHGNYYAVPGNIDAIASFRHQVARHWLWALRRRSQRSRLPWERMRRLERRWLPTPRIQHPWPSVRFSARTQGRSPVR